MMMLKLGNEPILLFLFDFASSFKKELFMPASQKVLLMAMTSGPALYHYNYFLPSR